MNQRSPMLHVSSHRDKIASLMAIGASAATVAVGLLVLGGWVLDVAALKNFVPGLVSMKANTALGLMLLGGGFLLIERGRGRIRWGGWVGTSLALLLGVATLAEYVLAVDLRIDQLLFQDHPQAIETSHPGRMAPITAANFALLGLAILAMQRSARVTQVASLGTALTSLLAIAGYAYGVEHLYGMAHYTSMAVHTAATFLILSLGMLLSRPHVGLVSVLMADTVGGLMARRLLPAMIGVLFLLGLLTVIGVRVGFYDMHFGMSLLVLASIVVLSSVVWVNARWLHRIDVQRLVAEENVRQEHEWFQTTIASIGDAVIATDTRGYVRYLNSVAEELTGWQVAEAEGRPLEEVFRIINEFTRQPAENPVAKVLRVGQVVGLANHTLLIARDGTERAIDDSAAPIRRSDGTTVGVVMVFRDVTEKRRAESDRSRLAALIEGSEDAIIGLSVDGIITDWNIGAELLLAYASREIVGRFIADTLFPRDQVPQLSRMLEQVRQGQRIDHFESAQLSRHGDRIPVSIRLSPIRDSSASVIGVSLIARDISQRKHAEQRRNARLAVTQALSQADAIEDAAPRLIQAICDRLGWDVGALWTVTGDGRTLRCQHVWHAESVHPEAFLHATREHRFAQGIGLPGRIWSSRQPAWIDNVVEDGNFPRASHAQQNGLHAAFGCPIVVGEEFLGVLEFFSREIREPDEDLLETMTTIGSQIGQFMERKQAERQLQTSELRFRQLAENIDSVFWIADPHQPAILYISPAYESIWGRSCESLYADPRSFLEAVLPDDRPAVFRTLQQQEQGCETSEEYRIRTPEGIVRWIYDRGFPIRDAEGNVQIVCGIAQDITDRKQTEATLRFLAEASESLASLVDYRSTMQKVARMAVPDFADWCAVDVIDEDGRLERVAVAHVDPEKVQLAHELHERYPPDPDAEVGVTHVLRTGEPELVGRIGDEVLQAAAVNEDHLRILRDLELTSYICVPLKSAGKTTGALSFVSAESKRRYGPSDLSIATDLAHRAEIAIENARLYTQLKDADRRKDEFLAMLAHELRNPLAPIRTGLDVLAMDGSEQRETIALMQRQVEHLVRLVDDLLDISRIMRGRVELRFELVELDDIVKRSVEAVRDMVASRRQELVVSVPEAPLWLHADPVRLTQVVENLLNNASKYTDSEGRIELAVESHQERAVLRVRDNGIGIEKDLLPKVFDLFSQASQALDRSQGGLGIGLTLVRNLVELHGGNVTAESPGIGRGSEFVVRLPLVNPADYSPPQPVETVPAPSLGRRVLVVDDNVGAARMLSMLLQRLNAHEVAVAHDGAEALQQLETFHPEIILLDIGLPGMDGYQLARTIRSRPPFRDVFLVAVTGYGQAEDRRRSLEAGFDEHLVKPLATAEIEKLFGHPKLVAGTPARPTPLPPPARSASANDPPPANAPASLSRFARRLLEDQVPESEVLSELMHEMGNYAHAVSMAAAVLERAKPSDHDHVVRMLEQISAAIHTLIASIREKSPRHAK